MHSFLMHPYGFLMFSGGRERMYGNDWVNATEYEEVYAIGAKFLSVNVLENA